MSGGAKVCNTVYWLGLTIWVSVLVAAAVAAATTFTVLPKLGLTIEAYAALPPAEHGRVAAGKVMEPIFTFVDLAQMAAAAIVLFTVAVQWLVLRYPLRRATNVIRIGAIVLAAGVFAWRAAALTPEMNRELRQYWTAAEAGDVAAAAVHRETFNEMHPLASDLFSATLALLFVAVIASPAALAAPVGRKDASPETPALARQA